MNGFDIISLALIFAAARRGYKNGLAVEFYRLFRIAVALLAGTSLYSLLSDAVAGLLNMKSGYSDPLIFVVTAGIAWSLLRRMRKWMEAAILMKTPKSVQAKGGAAAAAIKTGVYIVVLVTMVSLSTWMPGHQWIAKESFIGKTVVRFLPET